MTYLFLFLIAFVLSISFSYFAKNIGYKYKLLSHPRSRDIHKKPIPRIGGAAIFLAFFLTIILAFYVIDPNLSFGFGHIYSLDRRLIGILVGGLLITLFMLFDDIKGLKAWQKFGYQIIVALVVIASGIGINYLSNPFGPRIDLNTIYIPIFVYHGVVYHFSLISDLLTLVWIVGMMNVINFVDGVDGLASGLSTIAAGTIFLLSISAAVSQPATATVAIILAGASLGFLFWNFPPAKIFMGDSGAMFLGFMLGVLPLISGGKLATVFLVLGFPIVDGLIVAASRLVRGKSVASPDKTHLHHRFLAIGLSPRQAIFIIYIIAAAFGWVALRSTTLEKIIASLILFVMVASFLIILSTIQKRKSKEA
jgi:UDP-GlcNAc:undecaprenyl-phosphate/decaprenyl-phosphate GlcNAc-1-phosphate transferase